MRNLLFLLFCFIGFESISQIPPPKSISIKVYTKDGMLITKNLQNYSCFISGSWYGRSGDQFEFEKDSTSNGIVGFSGEVFYDGILAVKIKTIAEEMTIHAESNLDSITFTDGKYYFNDAACHLLNIVTGSGIVINNSTLNNFADTVRNLPYFYYYESDYSGRSTNHDKNRALKTENIHGGHNWTYWGGFSRSEPTYISEDIKVQNRIDSLLRTPDNYPITKIYPLNKKGFIKHDYFRDSIYIQKISFSEDAIIWKHILTIKNEWRVNLCFFPENERIGIEIQYGGVFLMSDYNLTEWKYFFRENDKDIIGNKIKRGLIFQNSNWYEGFPRDIFFSEE